MAAQVGPVFVLPISAARAQGALAPWITTSGWAQAADRIWGSSRIITPDGTFDAKRALAIATAPKEPPVPRLGRSRELVPGPVITAAKDLEKAIEARRFRKWVLDRRSDMSGTPWVWQRHALFHTVGIDLARRLDVPCVLSVHAGLVREGRSWGMNRPGWDRWLESKGEVPQMREADVVACVSEEVADLVAGFGVPEQRIVLTPNGVDLDHFSPRRVDEHLRAALGLQGKFVVGWAGTFRKFQSVDLVIDGFAAAQREHPDMALLLVGDGSQQPAARERVEELGLENALFTGTVAFDALPKYINLMDVAVVASRDTEFHYSPVKLREYMACGRAVVAPRVGEMARNLRDGEDAILTRPGSAQELAGAVVRMRDDGLRERMGLTARRKAEAEMSWDAVLAEALDALDRVA